MVNKEDLANVGYLAENMDYSDSIADLAFTLFKKYNKLNVINPHIELESLEITEKTGKNEFYEKWKNKLNKPDPNYNGNTEPEMLNAMNVLWKDEHSPSTSHSPAFDAMAMSSVYYYMSTAKDFLSPRSTKLYINIANKDYTYRFNKAKVVKA